jgi:hypothetical protein
MFAPYVRMTFSGVPFFGLAADANARVAALSIVG